MTYIPAPSKAGYYFVLIFFLILSPGIAQDSLEFTQAEAVDSLRVKTGSGEVGQYHKAYYQLKKFNGGLHPNLEALNLQSPQAALEYFYRKAKAGHFAEAGQMLNLNLYPEGEQARLAPQLARQLYYVIDRQLGFDWEGLPDRPDGIPLNASSKDPMAGQPRRNVLLGMLKAGNRDIALRLQRVKTPSSAPIWVFSPQTVENIIPLYQKFGPGPLEQSLPAWAKQEILAETPLWAWGALLLMLAFALGFAYLLGQWVKHRYEDADSRWLKGASLKISTPVAAAGALLLVYLLSSIFLSLPGVVNITLLILLILSVIWLGMRLIKYFTETIVEGQVDDISELSDNTHSRQQRKLTYLSVGRRVMLLVLVVIGAGLIANQFEGTKGLGVTLLASAGVLTILLGIAAQPALGNIVASIQIALAKPVRIGDSVYFEGNWGYVEDIQYTYVLIQTWDQRRIVVPVRYFITHPVENWTMRNAHIVKPIVIHADYTVDVDKIRRKFDELLRNDKDWDGENEPKVQVLSVGDETVEVRALCSAKDPSTAWDMHCRLREQLLTYVRELKEGSYLPKRRVQLNRNGQPTSENDRSDVREFIR